MFIPEQKYKKYIKEQKELAKKLVLKDKISKIEKIAGIDQAFFRNRVISCILILSYPDFKILEKSFAHEKVKFPYIPGLLAYREMPAILKAYEKLKQKPDVILVDAHGIAHPRNFGLASHIGFLLSKPTIGVAKRKLVGNYEEPKIEGEHKQLKYKGKIVGYVLKTKENSREIFISPGNLISLAMSLKIIMNCTKNHKLPEPIRLAHQLVNEEKRKKLKMKN